MEEVHGARKAEAAQQEGNCDHGLGGYFKMVICKIENAVDPTALHDRPSQAKLIRCTVLSIYSPIHLFDALP